MSDGPEHPGWVPPSQQPSAPGWGQPGHGPPPPGWGPPPPPPPPGQPGWGQPPWGPPAWEIKPGIVPLRPLGLGEILDGAFTLIRRHPRVTLGLSAMVATISAGLSLVVNLGLSNLPDVTSDSGVGSAVQNANLHVDIASLVVALVSAILTFILTGMLTVVVGEAVLGRQTDIRTAWARVRPRFFGLVGVSLLAGLLPYLGLIALIVGGVFLWGALAVAVPAYVLEQIGPIKALRRSWRLVKGSWWRVFGIRLLGSLIVSFVSGVIAVPFALAAFASAGVFSGDIPTGTPVVFFVLIAIGSLVAQTITAPLLAGILALLYVDRRIRTEALDVVLISTVTGGAPPAAAPPRPQW